MDYIKIYDKNKYIFDGDVLKVYQDFKSNKNPLNEKSAIEDKRKLSKVTVFVANACNANCLYCYEKHDGKIMKKEEADCVIEYLSENYDRVNLIAFFGGEPLLNYIIIKYIVNKLSTIIKVDSWQITTNASLLNDDMLCFFEKHNFEIIVSIDGPSYIHDQLRIGCKHDLIERNIRKIRNSTIGKFLRLNCTVTKVHQNSITRQELIHYFNQFQAKYLLTDVNTTIENLKLCMDNFSINKYIDESFNEILIYKYKELNNGYICNILNALIYHNVSTTFCNDLEIALSFNYDGKVYPCTKLNGKCSLGNKELCDNNNKALYACSNCWAKNFCTGCAAAYYLKERYIPENIETCNRRNGYEYAFDRLMWFYHYEPEKFQQIIDNFLL